MVDKNQDPREVPYWESVSRLNSNPLPSGKIQIFGKKILLPAQNFVSDDIIQPLFYAEGNMAAHRLKQILTKCYSVTDCSGML